jgi:hypothetical protein
MISLRRMRCKYQWVNLLVDPSSGRLLLSLLVSAALLSYQLNTFFADMTFLLSQLDGKANFNMHALMEIALERCDTARCAILLMGKLAFEHGFYAGGWDDSPETARDEAGEAIPISDKHETW